MRDPEKSIQIRTTRGEFRVYAEPAGWWHCEYVHGSTSRHFSGPDGAEVLAEAIKIAGFDDLQRGEIFEALMRALREGLN